MSKDKWMPPRLELEWYKESHKNKAEAKAIYDHAQRQFDSWYNREIRSLFEDATEVIGYRTMNEDLSDSDIIRYCQSPQVAVADSEAAEVALVVRKLPHKREDTAEALLRDIIGIIKPNTFWTKRSLSLW